MPHPVYVKFPVIETIDLSRTSTIRQAVDRMVEAYLAQDPVGKFSYRILLPRDQKSTGNAKMIGLAFQGEFLLGLRRRNVVPNVREVRYVHDEHHYGWLLANPQVYEQFEKGIV
ncbi:MAG TPA: hypothetical protein VKA09_07040 [Nitrososphaeraceae archaeon]|nr:hypothetical protein [Nitrososphaeraceae archaeon]